MIDQPDADLMAPEAADLDPITASPMNRLAHPAAYEPDRAGQGTAPAPIPCRLYVALDVHGQPVKGPFANEAEAQYWAFLADPTRPPCTLAYFDVELTPDPRPAIGR